MTVEEKRAAIGILKTMGLKNKTIRLTFVLQGFINGSIGILIGSILGVILAKNLANLLKSVENILGTSFLSGDIYFVNFLPSQLHWADVFVTAVSAFALCIIATLYPAAKAARVMPVQALNG
jgi:lipoprotein-releasing system permease protein